MNILEKRRIKVEKMEMNILEKRRIKVEKWR